jgi:hypothetical protein
MFSSNVMREMPSLDCLSKSKLTNSLRGAALCSLVACQYPTKPLVVNSEAESPFPSDSASDASLSDRAMPREQGGPRDTYISDDIHEGESFQGPMEQRRAGCFWQGVGDVIGFPVRAAGWVIQTIF